MGHNVRHIRTEYKKSEGKVLVNRRGYGIYLEQFKCGDWFYLYCFLHSPENPDHQKQV